MNTLPLSVVILAHQSDARLKAAVASVSWAAEVIIIWAGPAQEVPAKQTPHVRILLLGEPVSDFAEARNRALAEALHEWVFFLDSDEIFDSKSVPELEKIIRNPLVAGATVRRRDVFLQKEMEHGEVARVSILRLMRKGKAKYERKVHEIVIVDGQIAKTKILIYHFSHRSISDFLAKVVLYIQLEQQERAGKKEKFKLHEMLLFPPAKFIQNYFFRLGFADGWRGIVYAAMMSIHSFGVRASVYENQGRQK